MEPEIITIWPGERKLLSPGDIIEIDGKQVVTVSAAENMSIELTKTMR